MPLKRDRRVATVQVAINRRRGHRRIGEDGQDCANHQTCWELTMRPCGALDRGAATAAVPPTTDRTTIHRIAGGDVLVRNGNAYHVVIVDEVPRLHPIDKVGRLPGHCELDGAICDDNNCARERCMKVWRG